MTESLDLHGAINRSPLAGLFSVTRQLCPRSPSPEASGKGEGEMKQRVACSVKPYPGPQVSNPSPEASGERAGVKANSKANSNHSGISLS